MFEIKIKTPESGLSLALHCDAGGLSEVDFLFFNELGEFLFEDFYKINAAGNILYVEGFFEKPKYFDGVRVKKDGSVVAELEIFGDDFDVDSFLIGKSRFKDKSTTLLCAFILSCFGKIPSVMLSSSVVFCYKSIEYGNAELVKRFADNAKVTLSESDSLFPSCHVRKDAGHLKLSLLTALWNSAVFIKDIDLFCFSISYLMDRDFFADSMILSAASVNKSKIYIFLLVYLFHIKRSDKALLLGDLYLDEMKFCFSNFTPSDKVYIVEYRRAHEELSLVMALLSGNGERRIDAWFKRVLELKDFDHGLTMLSERSVRFKRKDSSVLVSDFYNFLMEDDDWLISMLNKKSEKNVFEKLSGIGEKAESADVLREVALSFEKIDDYETAYKIMLQAQKQRPHGSFINKKIADYELKLKKQKKL